MGFVVSKYKILYRKKLNKNKNELLIWAYEKYIVKYIRNILLYFTIKILSNILVLLPPVFLGKVIDLALSKDLSSIIKILIFVFTVIIVNSVISIFESRMQIYIIGNVTMDIKKEIFQKMLYLKMSDVDEISNGEFVSRLDDAENIAGFYLNYYCILVLDIITLIITVIIMLIISPTMALVCFINMPLIMLIQNCFGIILGKREKLLKGVKDNYYSYIYEMITNIKEIKNMCIEFKVYDKYGMNLEKFVGISREKANIGIWSGFASVILNGSFQILLIGIGCYLILQNLLTVGSYISFNSYLSKFQMGISRLSGINIDKQTIIVSVERIKDILELEDEFVIDNSQIVNYPFEISVQNLRFGYNEVREKVIDIDELNFKENSITAIVGKNGAGKTTLFDLIMRFYGDGECIFIGKSKIKNISFDTLRKQIYYIQQKPLFFNLSINDNLRLARPIVSDYEIENACMEVQIHNFINTLPEKYDTIIGENGVRFSGGQLQRLAIARGLLSEANIFLFDEITSNLDGDGENKLCRTLQKIAQSHIVIIIAHKLSTIIDIPRIIVLDEGKVEREGNHVFLLNNSSTYRELFAQENEIYVRGVNSEQ